MTGQSRTFSSLLGIQSELGYLNSLGIETIWLSPIYKSPMKDFGYDISDFRDVDPIFGNLDDFKDLLAEAHGLGMKIVMDFVPNHSSDEHEWFQKSVNKEEPYTDFYTWKDPKGYDDDGKPIPPNNWVRKNLVLCVRTPIKHSFSSLSRCPCSASPCGNGTRLASSSTSTSSSPASPTSTTATRSSCRR